MANEDELNRVRTQIQAHEKWFSFGGKVITRRRARKSHRCIVCHFSIDAGTDYYDVVFAAAGVTSNVCPDRIHEGCIEEYLGLDKPTKNQ